MSLPSRARVVLLGAALVVLLGMLGVEASCPGFGVRALIVCHGIYALRLALPLFEQLIARSQPYFAVPSMLLTIALLLGAVDLVYDAIAKLLIMIITLLALPFGPLLYIVLYTNLNRDTVRIALASGTSLWVMAGLLVLLSNPGVLRNRGQIMSFLLGFVLFSLVSILHGWLPTLLIEILDAIAGIVVALVGGIVAIRQGVALIRPLRELARARWP
jgi:hypothetical protein